MKKYFIHFLFFAGFVLTFTTEYANATESIMITGSLVNDTYDPWDSEFMFRQISGDPAFIETNVNTDIAPTSGKFIFIVPKGGTSNLAVLSLANLELCILSVSAVSEYLAAIRVLKYNDDDENEVKCRYTGDPVNDTATITLSKFHR